MRNRSIRASGPCLLCALLAAGPVQARGDGERRQAPDPTSTRQTPSLQDGKQKMQERGRDPRQPGAQEPSGARRPPASGDHDAAGGTDTRDSQGQPGSTTGSTGHGGMPGSGASSGSGGTPDLR
ncbi:hypothetical protein [Bordetella petrii]|uniref:hypothetical protein n=1 Tax=Bordetella petrii TaxID=94624 RepID=UPI003733B583